MLLNQQKYVLGGERGAGAFAHIKRVDPGPGAEGPRARRERGTRRAADGAEQGAVLKLLKILHPQITSNLEENTSRLYPPRAFRVIRGRRAWADQ